MVMTLSDKAKLTNFAEYLMDDKKIKLKKGESYKEDRIYGEHQEEKEYKLLDFYSNAENGYQGYAYKPLDDLEIYVVHAGSCSLDKITHVLEIKRDWLQTNPRLVANKLPGQFYSAEWFLNKVRKEQNNNQNTNLEMLGQSLG